MRNPYGSEQYNGPFSDYSREMTRKVRNELGHTKDVYDGVFYMDFDTFKYQLSSEINVSLYNSYKTSRVEATWDRTSAGFANLKWTVRNGAKQDVAVTLDMLSDRMFPRGCDTSDMSEKLLLRMTTSNGQ